MPSTFPALGNSRITALRAALSAGDAAALETFWADVAASGTPLIDPLADHDAVALVTFLWRGDAATTHVVVYSEFLARHVVERLGRCPAHRLGDTNVWCRSYRIRTDMRFVYWLAPNHPLHHVHAVDDWDRIMPSGALIPSICMCSSRPSTAHMLKCLTHDRTCGFSHGPVRPPDTLPTAALA